MFPFRLLIKGLWMNDVSEAGVLLYPFPILIDIFFILSYIKQLRLKDTLLFAAVKSQTTAVSYFFNWILNPFCDRHLWTVPNSNGFFPFLRKRGLFSFNSSLLRLWKERVCLSSSSGKEQGCLMNEPRKLCNFKFLPAACGMVSQWVEF